MKYGRGHIPDPNEHMRTSFDRLADRLHRRGSLLPAVDLRGYAPVVMDQGQTSSCTGHAVAGAAYTTMAAWGQRLDYVPSPDGIYRLARCLDRTRMSAPLQDNGAMPNQVFRGVSEFGVQPMGELAPDGRISDADPKTINDEPKLGALEQCSTHLLTGEYQIGSMGIQRQLDLQCALHCMIAVPFATFVDTAMENWNPSKGPLGAPDRRDPEGGGHYIYALGYRFDAHGKMILIFRNSWGKGWGIHGDGEGDENFIAQLTDIVAARFARKYS